MLNFGKLTMIMGPQGYTVIYRDISKYTGILYRDIPGYTGILQRDILGYYTECYDSPLPYVPVGGLYALGKLSNCMLVKA